MKDDSSTRVLRGGSWYYDPQNCRSAERYNDTPGYRSINVGFRLVRNVKKEKEKTMEINNKLNQFVEINRGPGTKFEICEAPVTQAQYEMVMGENPSYFKNSGPDAPVESVSFNNAQAFIKKLNEIQKEYTYRLPTEEEWEHACRASSTTKFSFGDDEADLKDYAWYCENSEDKTHPVKQKKPNAWGLYDMHGNVWEWTDSVY